MPADLCFVLMPFGRKQDATDRWIDFDAVYASMIAPAIRNAALDPIRADQEEVGGLIHKPMFERLVLCRYAVADLTAANANVFYELGVRHAVRPWSTVLLFAEGSRLPFDVQDLRCLRYALGADGTPGDAGKTSALLTTALRSARDAATDSPVFQLVDGFPAPQLDHSKTDVFREHVRYSSGMKERLAEARSGPAAEALKALRTIEAEIGTIADTESGVVIDLFLSYRAIKAWGEMRRLVGAMSRPLAETVMVQEQLALALNRDGEGARAERVLVDLIARRGPSSETYGILGRVYKDRWDAAQRAGETVLARGLLDKAIEAYLRGFEADWRDAYPGINAVTLMELRDPPDSRRLQLVPVVQYSVQRRIASGKPDYWDYATALELAVLAKDEQRAAETFATALAHVREGWEPETTARNLRLIRETRERRGDSVPWMMEIEAGLDRRAKR